MLHRIWKDTPKTQVRKITAIITSAESNTFLLRSDVNELWCKRHNILVIFSEVLVREAENWNILLSSFYKTREWKWDWLEWKWDWKGVCKDLNLQEEYQSRGVIGKLYCGRADGSLKTEDSIKEGRKVRAAGKSKFAEGKKQARLILMQRKEKD